MRLAGKRVLITGAARGIGRALAERLAAERSSLVLADRRGDEVSRVARALGEAGAACSPLELDVADEGAVARARAEVLAAGPLDVLVNNAGVVFGGPFLDVALARHAETFRVNVAGVVTMTHAFLPALIERPEAHLVNVASASALVGLPWGSTYAASKWAVAGLTESLRLELGLLGHAHVGVTAVCPSYVATGLFEGARAPRTTRILTAERVARLIVRAIERNRPWVLTPWLVRATPPLKGLLPTRWFDRVARGLGATTGMIAWRGQDATR